MYDAHVGLQDSVSVLKGIGPKSVRLLAKLDVHTVGDLLTMFPRRFEDRTKTTYLSDCIDGEAAFVTGVAGLFSERQIRKNLSLSKLTFRDDAGVEGEAVWFVPKAKLARIHGMRISLYGKVKRAYGRISIQNPDIALLSSDQQDAIPSLGLVPVYALTEGLTQANLREWVEAALTTYAPTLPDDLPRVLRAKHGLPHQMTAIKDMHVPVSSKQLEAARRRFAYEELLTLHGVLQSRKLLLSGKSAPRVAMDPALIASFRQSLPFTLTAGQEDVIADVLNGLSSTNGMLRLIQGDVGCGKTVVAAAGLLAAVASGYQGAFLAPTDLLARQQLLVLKSMLEPLGHRVELLNASIPERQRKTLLDFLAAGEPVVVVGTHAIIEENVLLPRLALAVIDEQHRFGVGQRNALMTKPTDGIAHMVLMSATPIPRTLTQVTVGDVEVSTISSLPQGRKPIRTHIRDQNQRAKVYDGVRAVVEDGGQAYIVCPAIAQDGNDSPESVIGLFADLSNGWLKGYRLGIVHGKLREEERTQVMDAFRRGEIDVLIATAVIEVGVDVPRANAIVIESADQFGLAQLHQLRGRVGRGDKQSFCVLITSPNATDIGIQRLNVMSSTTDGFVIAQEDLRLRGPGDVIGLRQSGVPQLRVTDLSRDNDLSQAAAEDAREILEKPNQPEFYAVQKRIAGYVNQIDVGAVA